MSRSALKYVGIGLSALCGVLLFVAVERYQANAASVAAMNQMVQSSPIGQMTPGVPAITTYAVLFAILSAAGAIVCFVQSNRNASAA